MDFTELFIYSLIQGVTEFLPISSSAHLVLLEGVFNWESAGRWGLEIHGAALVYSSYLLWF